MGRVNKANGYDKSKAKNLQSFSNYDQKAQNPKRPKKGQYWIT